MPLLDLLPPLSLTDLQREIVFISWLSELLTPKANRLKLYRAISNLNTYSWHPSIPECISSSL